MSTLLVYLGRKCTLPYISQDTISLRDVFVGGVTLGFFFSHPAITAQSLKLLFCERVGVEADDYYLTADLTVQCYTTRHWMYVFCVATPMLLFYVLGFPVFWLYTLFSSPEETLVHDGFKARYAFLYRGYRVPYWESTVLIRKSTLVAFAVLLTNNLHLQATMVNLLCVAATVLYYLTFPLNESHLNRLELVLLVVSTITFYFGSLLFVDGLNHEACSVFILVMQMCWLALVAWLLTHDRKTQSQCWKNMCFKLDVWLEPWRVKFGLVESSKMLYYEEEELPKNTTGRLSSPTTTTAASTTTLPKLEMTRMYSLSPPLPLPLERREAKEYTL